VGGQARDQKRLGRGGDDRGWQARSAGPGLTADEVGMTLAEGKNLLGELGRLILQTQMEEFITRARVCGDCLKLRRLRDQRTLPVQERFELCGCLPVAPDGIAPGPMHVGTPAASGGVGRPAFLSRGGAATGDASAVWCRENLA
jgi:hypothetical protein